MAEGKDTWQTRITDVAPDSIRYRGYPVEQLMGTHRYAAVVYLLLTGELPDSGAARILDAILVSSMDHGATPPSTLASRTAASTGAPLNAALAAGLLSINEFHGGAIAKCMGHLDAVREAEGEKGSGVSEQSAAERLERTARSVAEDAKQRGERLAGFGHRVHGKDPRVERLFAVARGEGRSGRWIERARALESALARVAGKSLPLNVDGAIAAVLCELGLGQELANGIFMIARLPGLLAQVAEERALERPMRQITPGRAEYTGPPPRDVTEEPGG